MKYWLCIAVMASQVVMADTASQITSWFNNMDYANITNPGVIQTQSALYGTLGGISTHAPITQPFHFIDIQTPRYSAGCGGIDLYGGGFNMINANQFVDNLQAIGQNASSLAFMLGLQIVSPQLAGRIENLSERAQDFNTRNMDSCEAATKLVGGTLDFFGATEGNCTVKRMNQFGEDWGTANHLCRGGGGRTATENSPGGANQVTFSKGNLTWFVLMQDPFFSNDLEFAELIMNLIGTVIISDVAPSATDDTPKRIRVFDAAINENGHWSQRGANIFNALWLGREMPSTLEYYTCNDRTNSPEACVQLSDGLRPMPKNWAGINSLIREQLTGIVDRIYDDQPLTPLQQGILQSTNIPLYDYLVAVAAYFPRGVFSTSNVKNEFVNMIAKDIVLRNLQGVIEMARHASTLLPNNIGQSKEAEKLRDQINNVISGIAFLHEKNAIDGGDYVKIQQRTQMYQKAVMSRVSPLFIQSSNWGQ